MHFIMFTFNSTDGYLGFNGPLRVEAQETGTLVGKAFLEAGRELGYQIIDGMGPQQIGRLQSLLRSI